MTDSLLDRFDCDAGELTRQLEDVLVRRVAGLLEVPEKMVGQLHDEIAGTTKSH